jgi:hypothetical protein
MYTQARLRYKLSPLEDRGFTELIEPMLRQLDFTDYVRRYKGGEYIVLTPRIVWDELFDEEPNLYDLTKMGRSLQALLWERSYLKGNLIFVKSTKEYIEDGL